MRLKAICLIVLLLAQGGPLLAADIEWEVANRFRLFRDEAQFRALLDVFKSLPADQRKDGPALALETELEMRAAKQQLGTAFGPKWAVARFGWSSGVVGETCFQPGNRSHWPCKLATGDEFLRPARFKLIARLTQLDSASAAKPCTWQISGRSIAAARCDADIEADGLSFGVAFDMSVTQAGAVLASAGGQSARNVNIVGLGDSFGAGEGNPDRPAILTGKLTNPFSPPPSLHRPRLYPLRPDATRSAFGPRSQALWWLQQCHRSLYGNQVKAALQLALEQSHLAVTFLGYSCTGAAVDKGLLGFWEARSDVPAKYRDDSPQLMRVMRDLCPNPSGYNRFTAPSHFDWRSGIPNCSPKRLDHIDALLLSIGGNDAGFSSVIVNYLVDTRRGFGPISSILYRVWKEVLTPLTFEQAEAQARKVLPDAYKHLAEALKDRLGVGGDKIIQTAYPLFATLGDNSYCGVTTAGKDVHEIFGIGDPAMGSGAARFVELLNGIIRDAVEGLAPEARWILVTRHVGQFSGHAICQGGADGDVPDSAIAGGMTFPTGHASGKGWKPFAPDQWVAYRPKQRWFVTPNDAFLTVNYMMLNSLIINVYDRLQPVVASTLSGAFHPNALGQAAVADAILPELRRVVGVAAPQ